MLRHFSTSPSPSCIIISPSMCKKSPSTLFFPLNNPFIKVFSKSVSFSLLRILSPGKASERAVLNWQDIKMRSCNNPVTWYLLQRLFPQNWYRSASLQSCWLLEIGWDIFHERWNERQTSNIMLDLYPKLMNSYITITLLKSILKRLLKLWRNNEYSVHTSFFD